jgi:hypothetical protein
MVLQKVVDCFNLLKYSSFVLNSFEDGCQVDSIYTDFSKTF